MKELNIILLSVLLLSFSSINCSFQTKIFSSLNEKYNGKNLIISPFSIFQVLSLATNGANGETKEAMLKTLGIEDIETLNNINYELLDIFKKFSTVEVANAIMSRITVKNNFLDIADKYSSSYEPLVNIEQVNNWCNKTTHGRIPKILDDLDDNIRMILLNAIYFKGLWTKSFDEYSTIKSSFYNFNRVEKQVDRMLQTEHFNYYEDNKIQMVELPFQKDYVSAIIILPNQNIKINEYINSFKENEELGTELNNIIKNKLTVCKVKLELPKFEVNFSEKLNDILSDFGMKVAFSDSADFSNLSEEENVKIGRVIHKTFLKIDENGAEAAAVTGMTFDGATLPTEEKIYSMIVDRPFLFILRDRKLPENYDMMFIAKIEEISENN